MSPQVLRREGQPGRSLDRETDGRRGRHWYGHAGILGGAALQAEGVRGGRLSVQAPPRGTGENQPADPGELRVREQIHSVHHGDPQSGMGAACYFSQQVTGELWFKILIIYLLLVLHMKSSL